MSDTGRLGIGESPGWIGWHAGTALIAAVATSAVVWRVASESAAGRASGAVALIVTASLAVQYRRRRDRMDAASFGYLRFAIVLVTVAGVGLWYLAIPAGAVFFVVTRRDQPRVAAAQQRRSG